MVSLVVMLTAVDRDLTESLVCLFVMNSLEGPFFSPVRSRWEENRFAQSLFYALFLSAFVAYFPLSFPIVWRLDSTVII